MDDSAIMLCIRTIDKTTGVVEGSTTIPCEWCAEQVWVSPTTLKVMEEKKAKAMCLICFSKNEPTPTLEVEVDPRMRREVEDELRKDISKN